MKKIISLFLILSCLSTVGQVKKVVSKNVVQSKPIISEIDVVKKDAEDWFKSKYVEAYFKDPYSYKLLKTTVTPRTLKEAILDSIVFFQYNIDTCSLILEDRTEASRLECKKAYEESLTEIKRLTELIKIESDDQKNYYNKKRIAIHKEYALSFLQIMMQIDLYNLNVNEKKNIENRLRRLNEVELSRLAYYEVKIDCYSNNSLGNQILGRFAFPFTKNGPLDKQNELQSVKHLNKE